MRDEHLSRLVDQIYEAAVVPEGWPAILDAVTQIAGAAGSVLVGSVNPRDRRWIASNSELDELTHAHLERFAANKRTERLVQRRLPGFMTDRDVLSQEEMAHEPIYQEYLLPRGLGHGVGTAVFVPSGDVLIVHAERRFRDGPAPPETIARLDRLRPHLARAGLLSYRLALEGARGVAQALAEVGLPAAVLTRRGGALAANDLLVRLMPHALEDLPSRLRLAQPGADALLAAALEALDRPEAGASVRSIPLAGGPAHPPLVFHLVPFRGAAQDVFTQARAMLIATLVVPKDAPGAEVLQGLFDLTPAEARIARGIAAGGTVEGLAVVLGVSRETVRAQLKQVFAKTGAGRQAELVRLLGVFASPQVDK